MAYTDSNADCPEWLNTQIKAIVEELYSEFSGAVSRRDGLHTAVVRLLSMENEQNKLNFLHRTRNEQRAYLIRAMINNSLQELRRHKWLDVGISPEGQSKATVSDFAKQVEAKDAVAKAIEPLAKRQREIIELVDIQGLLPGEAAEYLGTSAGNVRLQRLRALKNMKKFFTEKDITP